MTRTLQGRFLLVLGIFVLLGGISFLLQQNFTKAMEQDQNLINMAGAQRMQTQRMVKEALLFAAGHAGAADELRRIATRFEATWTDIVESERRGQASPASALAFAERTQRVDMLWQDFREQIELLLSGGEDQGTALQYLIDENEVLLQTVDDLVNLLVQDHGYRLDRLSLLQSWLLVLGLGGVGLAYGLTGKWLVAPLQRLEKTATQIAAGRRDVAVPRTGLRELDALSTIFELMRDKEQEMLSAVIEQMDDPLLITDSKGVLTYVNPAFERATGYTKAEAVGQTPRLLNSGRQSKAFYDNLWQTILSGKVYQGEIVNKTKSGELIYWENRITSLRDSEGRISSFVGMPRDLTERRRREEEKARLLALIENTPDVVAMADADGTILYINEPGKRMLEIGAGEDLSGMHIRNFHPPWAAELVLETGIPTAVRSGVWHGETALLAGNEWEIPVSQIILAHQTADGQLEFLSTIMRDLTQRKRIEEELAYLAAHDPLTGLFNRRRLQEELQRQVAHARRYESPGALLMIDLDKFKDINDSLGHRMGDEILKRITSLLLSRLRESDILARLGGDEFAVILTRAEEEDAKAVAADLLETMQKTPFAVDEQMIRVQACIGIALFPRHGTSEEDLLIKVDLALYQAKDHGGNRYNLYEEDQDWPAVLQTRLSREQQLRDMLEQDTLQFHVQPILDLQTRKVSHYEMLLRFPDQNGELVGPRAFLDVAERSDLIHELDRWVLRRAIALIAEQSRSGRPLALAVNLSGKSLGDDALLDLIQTEVATSGIDPALLELEITETAAIADLTAAVRFIRTLKGLGCTFALDDFGMGFSSFEALKYLPVDYLKIDGSFIRKLSHDHVDQHLVQAMVAVARGLGKQTIAEHVEDEPTLQLLQEYGVDSAQGYHVGRPGPVSECLDAQRW